jgi:hypothetical protein
MAFSPARTGILDSSSTEYQDMQRDVAGMSTAELRRHLTASLSRPHADRVVAGIVAKHGANPPLPTPPGAFVAELAGAGRRGEQPAPRWTGKIDASTLEYQRLQRDAAAMTEDEVRGEVAAALNRVHAFQVRHMQPAVVAPRHNLDGGVAADADTVAAGGALRCGICREALTVPIHSCTLRRHVFCGGCVAALGGRHRCTACVPSSNAVWRTSADVPRVAPDERWGAQPGLLVSAPDDVARRTDMAVIDSVVDPAVRDLRLEGAAAAQS